MDRLQMQLVNAGAGFVLGYVVGSWLRDRKTGLLAGLLWGAFSGLTAGETYDRLAEEATSDSDDTAPGDDRAVTADA